MKIISCGFIVRSKEGKILLGKAFNGKPDEPCWSVFKGGVEGNESNIETAIRELREETSVDVNQNTYLQNNISTSPVHNYSVKNKDVYLFLLDDKEGVLNNFEFKCQSFWGDGNPEILEFKWFDLDDVYRAVFHSQKGIVDALRRMNA